MIEMNESSLTATGSVAAKFPFSIAEHLILKAWQVNLSNYSGKYVHFIL